MNALEQRLSDALEAYAEGLTMTTSDIDQLEQGLEDRMTETRAASRARRNRIWHGAVAACAVTGVALGAIALTQRDEPKPGGAPAPSAPTITVGDLEGLWRFDEYGSSWVWQIGPKGELSHSNIGDTNENDLFAPGAPGEVTTTGTTITFGTGPCPVIVDARISEAGVVTGTALPPAASCGAGQDQIPAGEALQWTRISPRSSASDALTSRQPTVAARPVGDDLSLLRGTWLLKGTGTVLGIGADNGWVIDDLGIAGGPSRGTVAARPGDSIALTLTGDPSCVMDWTNAKTTNAELTTTLTNQLCTKVLPSGSSPSPQTWIRIN